MVAWPCAHLLAASRHPTCPDQVMRELKAKGFVVGIISNHLDFWFETCAEAFSLSEIVPPNLVVVSQAHVLTHLCIHNVCAHVFMYIVMRSSASSSYSSNLPCSVQSAGCKKPDKEIYEKFLGQLAAHHPGLKVPDSPSSHTHILQLSAVKGNIVKGGYGCAGRPWRCLTYALVAATG